MAIAAPTAAQVAEAVIRIRRRKLPDPAVLGNAGSFFKNPIVPTAQADTLLAAPQALPIFRGDGAANHKLSAAWLIDACCWKDHRDCDAGVSPGPGVDLVHSGGRPSNELAGEA